MAHKEQQPPVEMEPKSAPQIQKTRTVNSIFVGIPELEYFESDENRDTVLAQVTKEIRQVARYFWLGMLAFSLVSLTMSILLLRVPFFIGLPTYVRGGVTAGIAGFSASILLHWRYRRQYPALLRQKLIEQGVPMCLKCGYNLRGQSADSTRCPECGTPINEASRKILVERIPASPTSS